MASRTVAPRDVVKLLSDAGRPLHARELAAELNVKQNGFARLLSVLEELAEKKQIKRFSGQRFAAKVEPKADDLERWEGGLTVNPRGFGFVTARDHEDVYVAPENIGVAMHGDRVSVTIINRSSRGAEGRIEKVLTRRKPRVAGLLRKRGKSAWLEPDDTRLRSPIVVIGEVQGKDGDAAVAEIVRFPEFPDENPEAKLIRVLGTPGDPNVEVAKILVREQVEEQHPEGAICEAEAMAARLLPLTTGNRVDLRQVPLPTIDPEDARDHDDAVWVERHGDGYRAWIAIADVSEYVQPGTELDREALRRGSTIYLPDRAIPMLPAALAADLCSLLPEKERLCMCVIADLDRDAKVKHVEIVEGVMRSAAMLTYGGVARALGFTEAPPRSPPAEAYKRELKVMAELASKLRKIRMSRGALDLDLPEAKLVLDPTTGRATDVQRRTQDLGIKRAYNIIEELMLLANELVAVWLGVRKSPAIYRIHAKPDETKLERLADIAATLGVEFDMDEMQDAKGVSKFLARIQKHPRKQVLEMLLLRSLKQAAYDTSNVGHFGLASENYLHFTSPIRRYPDVQVHRAVKHLLRGGKPKNAKIEVEELSMSASQASQRERAVMEIEREVVDLYRALLMRDRLGDVCEGTVTALVGTGAFVTLDEPFVDVLVRFESMGPDRYEISEDELSVVGMQSGDRIALGDRVVVTIEDVSIARRQVYARRVPPDGAVDEERRPKRRVPEGRGSEKRRADARKERSQVAKPRETRRKEKETRRKNTRPERSKRGRKRR